MTAVLALTIAFTGGDDATLTRSIASVGGRNVILLAEPARRTLPYRHDFESEVGVRVVLGRIYDLGWMRDGTGFSDKAFPIWVIFRNQRDLSSTGTTDDPPKVVNGRVTFADTKEKTLGMSEISGLFPANKVIWSWFFDDERFTLAVKDITPVDLLNLVAKAGGGRVVDKDGTLSVEVDPTALRRRAQAAFRKIDPNGIVTNADIALMEELYGTLTDQEISTAYARRSSNLPVPLRTPHLQFLARQRLERLFRRDVGKGTGSHGWLRSTFDLDGELLAVIDPNGPPQVRVQSFDGKSALDY